MARDGISRRGQLSKIEEILQANSSAPMGGLFGEKFVNVLQVNLALHDRYGDPQ